MDNGHAYLFPKIIRSFERIVDKATKESTIEVLSAKVLTDESVTSLLKKEPFKNAIATDEDDELALTVKNATLGAGGTAAGAGREGRP